MEVPTSAPPVGHRWGHIQTGFLVIPLYWELYIYIYIIFFLIYKLHGLPNQALGVSENKLFAVNLCVWTLYPSVHPLEAGQRICTYIYTRYQYMLQLHIR